MKELLDDSLIMQARAEQDVQAAMIAGRESELDIAELQNEGAERERAHDYEGAAQVLRAYARAIPDAEDRAATDAHIAHLEELAEEQRAEAAMRRESVTEHVEQERRMSPMRIAGLAVIGGAALAGTAALVTGALANDTFSGFGAGCSSAMCTSEHTSEVRLGSSLHTASLVLSGIAIAGAGVGIVLVTFGEDEVVERRVGRSRAEQARLEVVPGPTPTGIGARLHF